VGPASMTASDGGYIGKGRDGKVIMDDWQGKTEIQAETKTLKFRLRFLHQPSLRPCAAVHDGGAGNATSARKTGS